MKLFFFFGSLRTGYWNNSRVISEGSHKVGDATTVRPFKLYVGKDSRIPTIVPDPKGGPVVGELWSLSDSDARSVYRLEAGYEFDEFQVRLPDGRLEMATIFHHDDVEDCGYLRGGYVEVPTGDYTHAITTKGERVK